MKKIYLINLIEINTINLFSFLFHIMRRGIKSPIL